MDQPAVKHVAICLGTDSDRCSWKVVTTHPDRDIAGHRVSTGIKGRPHVRYSVEPWEEEHPTMTHADAERWGHCWHAEAERENAERDGERP